MNRSLLGHLLALRYRLLWASVRVRRGKLVLFFVFYLIVMLVIAFGASGGVKAARIAMQTGQAELVAQIVLSGFFSLAMMCAVVLGVGMDSVFSDVELRRYPLTPLERLAARQLTAILDPLWLIMAALYLSFAIGLVYYGVATVPRALLGAVLLLPANYLFARVILTVVERLMATRNGQMFLLVFVMVLALAPSLLAPYFLRHPSYGAAFLKVLRLTPAFASASLMTGDAWRGFGLLSAWIPGLAVLLAYLDGLRAPSRRLGSGEIVWDGPCDRIAAFCGPTLAPLVSKVLRYYMRSPKFRYNYPFALPLGVILVMQPGSLRDPSQLFLTALGAMFAISLIGTGAVMLNTFGYDCSGFTRYHLLPVEPITVLRAVAIVPLALGAPLVLLGWTAWMVFPPLPTDAPMAVLLLSAGLSGLTLFNGMALWTSLLDPRPIPFFSTWGNKLSMTANVVLVGGIMSFVFVPMGLRRLGAENVLAYWYAGPALVLLCSAFYVVSLREAARLYARRRERLISQMEGRL